MQRPPKTGGMRHVALNVQDVAKAEHFYADLLGMQLEWRPDADNVYLCSGIDNVALHKATQPIAEQGQRLDHIGFILLEPEHVDAWHAYLLAHDVRVAQAPKTHRDGARSFYCYDPDGNLVQMIYHPPIASVWNPESV